MRECTPLEYPLREELLIVIRRRIELDSHIRVVLVILLGVYPSSWAGSAMENQLRLDTLNSVCPDVENEGGLSLIPTASVRLGLDRVRTLCGVRGARVELKGQRGLVKVEYVRLQEST